jgi:hypothetical protein
MPFTPAHPALFYPLKESKLNVCWTALLTGAVIPDFEYFLWLSPSAYVSHTFKGVLLFNLPMTFLIAMLWQKILGPVLLPLLPFFRDSIKWETTRDSGKWFTTHWLSFILSALLGIFSHLLWDSFSHANGYLAIRSDILIQPLQFMGIHTRWCYLLWYLSSIAGITIMMHWFLDPKKLFSGRSWKVFFGGYSFWGKVSFFTLLVIITRISFGLGWNWTRHLVIVVIGGFFYGLMIASTVECYRKSSSVFKEKPDLSDPA